MANASHLPPQPLQQPAPKVEPHRAPKPKPKAPATGQPAPTGQHGPVGAAEPIQLETTRAAALVLRHADHEAGVAVGLEGPSRQAGLIRAAQRMKAALYEVGALAELDPVEWQKLSGELASSLTLAERLRTELLRAGIGSLGQELAQAVEQLAPKVDRTVWAAARTNGNAALLPKLSLSERLEVVHSAIAAARLQLAPLLKLRDSEIRKRAATAFEPLQYHLAAATDAVLALPLDERRAISPEVEALSVDLSFVVDALTMTEAVPWNRAFALVFDTENQLRSAVGRPKQVRPYSGTVDPQAALQAVSTVAKDDKARATSSSPTGYQDPQAAVNGIALEMGHVFDQRLWAVKNLSTALQEPPPPKDHSIFDTLIGIAVNVALSAVGGGLGAFVADKVKIVAEKSAKAAVEAQVQREAAHLAADAQKALIEDRFKSGALAIDSAKDASKQMLKDTVLAVLAKHKPSELNVRQPLNAYIQQQEAVLVRARHDALKMVSHLASALAQLDLETLNHLVNELEQVPTEAYERQYDVSLREWENFRARLASEPAGRDKSGDPNLDAPRVNGWSEQPIPGVLEVGLSVGRGFGEPWASLTYLVLRGGEPNAIRYLKTHPRKLGEAGLNRQYQMSFLGWEAERSNAHEIGQAPGLAGLTTSLPRMVKVGVGVRDGFQAGSLRSDEMRLLKLYASGDVTALGIVAALALKKYDAIPDARAIEVAKQIIAEVDDVTTAKLED